MGNIHFAIKKGTLSVKSELIHNLLNDKHSLPILKNKTGLLFSDTILEKIIDKEARYNTKTLKTPENRSIRSFSSGEQKKIVLNYLIEQKPSFLVLDCPFESLDTSAVSSLKERLISLSSQIIFIQIFNRREEILPIISHVLEIKNDQINSQIPITNYNFKEQDIVFKGEVPEAITKYTNIPNQLIKLENVSVNYDDNYILNNINWTIHKNEFWHLIGPNGSGKTTILSMIYGNNIKAYGQEVYLFGNKKGSGESVWEIKEKIGYFSPAILELFQRKITVKQMVISGFYDSIGLYKRPTTIQNKLAEEWIDLLGLKTQKEASFQNLTTATQRLILIARAMIKHPPLLILDEPLINLNNQDTAIIVSLINKIVTESDTTVLFVSHRSVKDLNPDYIYELVPTENGSTGKIVKEN